MTIMREINGAQVEIVLTDEERRHAFEEQQNVYDVDDVKCALEYYLDCHEDATAEQLAPLIPSIAERYRKLIYKNGCYADYWDIVSDAIDDILLEEAQSE